MQSIAIDLRATFGDGQDIQALGHLLDLNHLVRRLCLKNWPRHRPWAALPRVVIKVPAMFQNLMQLEIRNVWFQDIYDLHDCAFPPNVFIEELLINCVFDDLDKEFNSFSLNPTRFAFGHPALSDTETESNNHPLRVLSLSYNDRQPDLFPCIVMRSLALGSAVIALRTLRVEVTCATHGCLSDIFDLFRDPGCRIEELELDLYDPDLAAQIENCESMFTSSIQIRPYVGLIWFQCACR
jgi:hypothetical protein